MVPPACVSTTAAQPPPAPGRAAGVRHGGPGPLVPPLLRPPAPPSCRQEDPASGVEQRAVQLAHGMLVQLLGARPARARLHANCSGRAGSCRAPPQCPARPDASCLISWRGRPNLFHTSPPAPGPRVIPLRIYQDAAPGDQIRALPRRGAPSRGARAARRAAPALRRPRCAAPRPVPARSSASGWRALQSVDAVPVKIAPPACRPVSLGRLRRRPHRSPA